VTVPVVEPLFLRISSAAPPNDTVPLWTVMYQEVARVELTCIWVEELRVTTPYVWAKAERDEHIRNTAASQITRSCPAVGVRTASVPGFSVIKKVLAVSWLLLGKRDYCSRLYRTVMDLMLNSHQVSHLSGRPATLPAFMGNNVKEVSFLTVRFRESYADQVRRVSGAN
jgi:hypothetical protein